MDKIVFHRCQNASATGDCLSNLLLGLSPGPHSGTSEFRPRPLHSTPSKNFSNPALHTYTLGDCCIPALIVSVKEGGIESRIKRCINWWKCRCPYLIQFL